jgi:uncharacterized RDD family membrane protein YckC
MQQTGTDTLTHNEQSAANPIAPAQLAGLWRRFGALIHELLFLVGYLFIVAFAFATVSGESMSANKLQILSGPIAILQQLYLFLSLGAYFVFFWTRKRRTLAFKTWQLRLVAARDLTAHPDVKQAVIRYLATWIGPALAWGMLLAFGSGARGFWIIAFFANFLWALVDPAKQFLHDRIAGTRVMFTRE